MPYLPFDPGSLACAERRCRRFFSTISFLTLTHAPVHRYWLTKTIPREYEVAPSNPSLHHRPTPGERECRGTDKEPSSLHVNCLSFLSRKGGMTVGWSSKQGFSASLPTASLPMIADTGQRPSFSRPAQVTGGPRYRPIRLRYFRGPAAPYPAPAASSELSLALLWDLGSVNPRGSICREKKMGMGIPSPPPTITWNPPPADNVGGCVGPQVLVGPTFKPRSSSSPPSESAAAPSKQTKTFFCCSPSTTLQCTSAPFVIYDLISRFPGPFQRLAAFKLPGPTSSPPSNVPAP